uniref:Protein kinase domain-containing protein n=1 Tax=Globodera rostochiensis TaxID=31243 RepID=A0A914I6U8_GLORO
MNILPRFLQARQYLCQKKLFHADSSACILPDLLRLAVMMEKEKHEAKCEDLQPQQQVVFVALWMISSSNRSNVPPRLDLGKRVEDDGAQALRQLRQNCGLLSGPKSPKAQPETLSMAAEADLRNDLMRLMIGDEHLLKIKAQYLDERTALNLRRPVSFSELEQYFQNKHGRLLNFYYTTSTRELMVQVHNQQDLDQVIKLHEGTGGTQRRMRLILSQKRDQPSVGPHGVQKQQQQRSPPSPSPLGIYRNPRSGSCGGRSIVEAPLSSCSSSVWSLLSGGSASAGASPPLMDRWPEETTDGLLLPTQAPTNWREGRCLGRGAFGQVFVCLNVDTGEQLVVKKVLLSQANTRHRQRVLSTLENELNALGTLRHTHIVHYLGVVQRRDCVHIFMELMAGGSLKDQISEYGALGEPITIRFTAQILDGLAYLHARDIVHRDIKPANILRHTHAHVKIADFGAAKFLQAICSDQGIDIQGTPHYTAPEIVRADGDRLFETRSDIWSVGITVVEMLTTLTPWAGIEPAAVHLRIAFDQPDLNALSDDLSTELRSAIEAMLNGDPAQRPQAAELLQIRPFGDPKAK